MFRGYRRLVCSLVCVLCILSMLYLDTCTAKASSFNPFDETITNSRSNIGTFTFHVTPSSQNSYITSMSFNATNAVPALSTRGSDSGSMYFNMIITLIKIRRINCHSTSNSFIVRSSN